MTIAIPIAVVLAFAPFMVALFGRGAVWKLLCLIACCAAAFGIITILGGLLAWGLAWTFATVALNAQSSHRRRERERKRAEKAQIRQEKRNDKTLFNLAKIGREQRDDSF